MTRGYHDTFVAIEAKVLGSRTTARVWQRGGILDLREQLSTIIPHASLVDIVESMKGMIRPPSATPRIPNFPIPERLYDPDASATMPDPEKQLSSSLAVRLTRAEKDALDVLADWPLSTTDQFAGLLGGVTKRRANQALQQSLRKHSLIHTDGDAHMLSEKASDTSPVGTASPSARPSTARAQNSSKLMLTTRMIGRRTSAPPCARWIPSPTITQESPTSPPP